jgi:hypothetical protein
MLSLAEVQKKITSYSKVYFQKSLTEFVSMGETTSASKFFYLICIYYIN